ncbi:hypothetical protein H845_3701 (plasmid) [Komagataeibacter xylinus E25]|nr:hypothetical protein H845_3701 [Komagataeibacter xylinus E25]
MTGNITTVTDFRNAILNGDSVQLMRTGSGRPSTRCTMS